MVFKPDGRAAIGLLLRSDKAAREHNLQHRNEFLCFFLQDIYLEISILIRSVSIRTSKKYYQNMHYITNYLYDAHF